MGHIVVEDEATRDALATMGVHPWGRCFYPGDIISAEGASPSDDVACTEGHCWVALLVSGAGTLIVDEPGASPHTIEVPAGAVELAIKTVYAGGTATGITGLY